MIQALGVAPSAPSGAARKPPSCSSKHAKGGGGANGAAEDAHLVAAACAHNAHLDRDKGGDAARDQAAPTRGHYLPVSVYGSHLGMLCVIVPRPDRRSMYNKLFFSVEQLATAAAKVAAAKAERAKKKGEPSPPPPQPPPKPTGLENFAAPPAVPAHLYDFVFVHEKLVLTHNVASGKTVGFTGHGPATAAEADANKTIAAVQMQGAAARAFADGQTDADMAKTASAYDDGLRLLLEGVNAFSTDPDVDQRATAELRARIDAYAPPAQRARRDSQTFDSAEHMFEVHVAEGEHARAELDAQLNHTGAVVSKLVSLHEADNGVLQDLYEHDMLASNELLAHEVARDHAKREREATKKAAEAARAADAAAKGLTTSGGRQKTPVKPIADPRTRKQGSAGRTPHASAASSRKFGF